MDSSLAIAIWRLAKQDMPVAQIAATLTCTEAEVMEAVRGLTAARFGERPAKPKRAAHSPRANFPAVYRYFGREDHADQFALGYVRLSTLETCRAYEGLEKGDAEEATLTYHSGPVVQGDSGDPNLELIMDRLGIPLGPGNQDVSASNCTRESRIPDAFVLCASTICDPGRFSGRFGKYCVRISSPARFFAFVERSLRWRRNISDGDFREITYRERSFSGLEDPPGQLGFVKPMRFSIESEFRFLWEVKPGGIRLEPFTLFVPKAAVLCERVE